MKYRDWIDVSTDTYRPELWSTILWKDGTTGIFNKVRQATWDRIRQDILKTRPPPDGFYSAETIRPANLPFRLNRSRDSADVIAGVLRDRQVVALLEFLRCHHEDSWKHSMRVALIATDIGLKFGFSHEAICSIAEGALLHDVGKSRVPRQVLEKNGPLTGPERVVMNQHPAHGVKLASGRPTNVKAIILSHHEFKTENAHPRSGDERRSDDRKEQDRRVPNSFREVLASIVATADVLDALVSSRAYKEALSFGDVEAIMRKSLTTDVHVINVALKMIDRRPTNVDELKNFEAETSVCVMMPEAKSVRFLDRMSPLWLSPAERDEVNKQHSWLSRFMSEDLSVAPELDTTDEGSEKGRDRENSSEKRHVPEHISVGLSTDVAPEYGPGYTSAISWTSFAEDGNQDEPQVHHLLLDDAQVETLLQALTRKDRVADTVAPCNLAAKDAEPVAPIRCPYCPTGVRDDPDSLHKMSCSWAKGRSGRLTIPVEIEELDTDASDYTRHKEPQ